VVIAMRSARSANIWRWPPEATADLRRQFPHVEFVEYERSIDDPLDDAALAAGRPIFASAQAAIAWRLDPRLWQGSSIAWIHCPSAAVHALLSPELVASAIVVTNGARVHASTVAEHGLALLLALVRGLPAALADQEYVRQYVSEVRGSRERLQQEFSNLRIPFWPSQANFVLARIGPLHAEFVKGMKSRGILVRDRSSDWDCEGCVRITAGWQAHTDRLLTALQETLKEIGWTGCDSKSNAKRKRTPA